MTEKLMLTEKEKEQVKELIIKIAEACRGYDAAIITSTLEIAFTETIYMQNEELGRDFDKMLTDFKKTILHRLLEKTNPYSYNSDKFVIQFRRKL